MTITTWGILRKKWGENGEFFHTKPLIINKIMGNFILRSKWGILTLQHNTLLFAACPAIGRVNRCAKSTLKEKRKELTVIGRKIISGVAIPETIQEMYCPIPSRIA